MLYYVLVYLKKKKFVLKPLYNNSVTVVAV